MTSQEPTPDICLHCGGVDMHYEDCRFPTKATPDSHGETCEHRSQWIIPGTVAGNSGWCFRCGAINLTGKWTLPADHTNASALRAALTEAQTALKVAASIEADIPKEAATYGMHRKFGQIRAALTSTATGAGE